MTSGVDFVLPSCYGVPESMWLVVSSMLGVMLQRCWLLLGAFVGVKMLVSAFVDLGEDRFSPATHIKIVGQTFLLAIFLLYYKTILMFFDYLIDSLCFFGPEVLQHTQAQAAGIVIHENWFLKWMAQITGGVFSYVFGCTQAGASLFMHYVKSISLIVLSVLGPISALFSLLPGPFRSSFKLWSRGYISVSCWAISLAIIDILEYTYSQPWSITHGFGSGLFSFALFIVTFLVPSFTSRIISSADVGNIVSSMGRGMTSVGKGAGTAWEVGKSAIGTVYQGAKKLLGK